MIQARSKARPKKLAFGLDAPAMEPASLRAGEMDARSDQSHSRVGLVSQGPAAQAIAVGLQGEAADVARGRGEGLEGPTGGGPLLALNTQDAGRAPRGHTHLDALQSVGNSGAARLEVGLLVGPEA